MEKFNIKKSIEIYKNENNLLDQNLSLSQNSLLKC